MLCQQLIIFGQIKIFFMKSFFLSKYRTSFQTDIAALLMRVGFGFLMIPNHGYPKLIHFFERKDVFVDFMGLGGPTSLALAVFAEFFCSILLIFGLGTRLAVIPLLITIAVIYSQHGWNFLGEQELVTAFLIGYLTIFMLGSGKYSLDFALFGKNKK